jgi:hypothetical protein
MFPSASAAPHGKEEEEEEEEEEEKGDCGTCGERDSYKNIRLETRTRALYGV